MSNAHRYLVFAIIDFLLAAYLVYRIVVPFVMGDAEFAPGVAAAGLLAVALMAMGVYFGMKARKQWGDGPAHK